MQTYISNIIKIRGFIPLDEFIFLSLCHPKYGYYTKSNPIKKDFITAPEISNAFGIVFASFIIDKILPISENAEKIHFIEFGGGSGKFAFDIFNFLTSLEKINDKKINNLISKIEFTSIEFSDCLTNIQKEKLNNLKIKKSFLKNISEFKINQKNDIKNENNIFVFFSNEFFDALPIKQFIKNENNIFEIIVTEKNNKFIFEKIVINAEILKLIPVDGENNFFEIPYTGINILEDIISIMKNTKSIFLTADYGYTKNPNTSTLQGIFNGKKNANILENVGNADITHLMNFTLFHSFFQKSGMNANIFSQGEFLVEQGIKNLITSQNYDGIQKLISFDEMGKLFNILIAQSFDID